VGAKPWTEKEIEELKRLYLVEGLVPKEIAPLLNKTRISVIVKSKRLKLKHTIEQTNSAKSRILSGEGNGMYGKQGWCKGLTKENCEKLADSGKKISAIKKEMFAKGLLDVSGSKNGMYGKPAWNKGLTKNTCEALNISGQKQSKTRKSLWENKDIEEKKIITEHLSKMAYDKRLNEDIVRERLNGRDIYLIGKIEGSDIKTEWQCKIGHIWSTTPTSILNSQTGCPHCAKRLAICEGLTGKFIHRIFPFANVEKHYLINKPIVVDLEIIRTKVFVDYKVDIKDVTIFVEYNGRQHYQPIKNFGGDEAFRKQKIRDKWLENYCKENSIPLILIDGRKYKGRNINAS